MQWASFCAIDLRITIAETFEISENSNSTVCFNVLQKLLQPMVGKIVLIAHYEPKK